MTVRFAAGSDLPSLLPLGELLADAMLPLEPEAVRPAREEAVAWERDTLRALAAGEGGFCLAAEDAGELVGYACVQEKGRRAHVASLFVAPGARGKGIGTALLEGARAEAKRRGLLALTIKVEEKNGRAAALYARQGFAAFKRELWLDL